MVKTMFQFSSVDEITDMKDMCKAFHIEAQLNSRNGNFSSLICLQALSSVIGQPIKSVYSVRKNVKLFHLFKKIFILQNQSVIKYWLSFGIQPCQTSPNQIILFCVFLRTLSEVDPHTKGKNKSSFQNTIHQKGKNNLSWISRELMSFLLHRMLVLL